MPRNVIIAATLGAFALAACSDDGTATATSLAPAPTLPTPTAGGSAGETIVMANSLFTPSEVSAATGTELGLDNQDDAVHNFSVEGSDLSVEIGAGEEDSVTVTLDAGTYTMFCEFHRSQGMEGTLTVT